MNLIVNADRNWGIGYKNKLLVRIPADMKFFRSETMGKVLVMGRKTLESFPKGKPLEGRVNIVLTRNPDYQVKGAVVVHNLEELWKVLADYPDRNVYVIGGESVYRQLLPFCDVAHVTKTDQAYEADTWFPNLDQMPEWTLTGKSEEQTYFDLEYHFLRYEKTPEGGKKK